MGNENLRCSVSCRCRWCKQKYTTKEIKPVQQLHLKYFFLFMIVVMTST